MLVKPRCLLGSKSERMLSPVFMPVDSFSVSFVHDYRFSGSGATITAGGGQCAPVTQMPPRSRNEYTMHKRLAGEPLRGFIRLYQQITCQGPGREKLLYDDGGANFILRLLACIAAHNFASAATGISTISTTLSKSLQLLQR